MAACERSLCVCPTANICYVTVTQPTLCVFQTATISRVLVAQKQLKHVRYKAATFLVHVPACHLYCGCQPTLQRCSVLLGEREERLHGGDLAYEEDVGQQSARRLVEGRQLPTANHVIVKTNPRDRAALLHVRSSYMCIFIIHTT